MKRTFVPVALILTLVAHAPARSASATPVPGGANQASGVAGTFGQKLFNGEVRLISKELRDANPSDDLSAPSGQKWIVFTAFTSNGTAHALDMQQFVASVADADGDTIAAQPDKVRPMGGIFGIPPGGRWKEQVFYQVPATFVPAKIVLLPYDRKHEAFRIKVRADDYGHG